VISIQGGRRKICAYLRSETNTIDRLPEAIGGILEPDIFRYKKNNLMA